MSSAIEVRTFLTRKQLIRLKIWYRSMKRRKGDLILGTIGIRSPSLLMNLISALVTGLLLFFNQVFIFSIWKLLASGRAFNAEWSRINFSGYISAWYVGA